MASGYSDLSEIRKDANNYAAHTKPPKINLLNEKPRRESLVEQQLATSIVRPGGSSFGVQQQVGFSNSGGQQASDVRSQQFLSTTNNQWSYIDEPSQPYQVGRPSGMEYGAQPKLSIQRQQESAWQNSYQQPQQQAGPFNSGQHLTRTTVETTAKQTSTYADLAAELAEKEAKLKREIAYFNQHQGPWSRPRQTREPRQEPAARVMRNDQRWIRECQSGSSSRPTSRASSTRSTTEADLMEKASKLLQDVEEFERKPLNTQQILIETGSRRSIDRDQQPGASSLHTAIINVPNYEPDNKSPLPFAFDNFSTLGVRGNIASVGAAEPDKPYPPIFPTIKRTPSPTTNKRH